ncbi:MAG TPA: cell division protein ZapA [Aquabacterium sp.]|nr:cell division protein ZapA [Aquabacterium sp.]HRH29644.1 cell division protein ZapA [Aquabacterium sp.]
MKQIEVSIMGQSYLLGCPEGGEDRLREAVTRVDREMCAIRDAGKLKARERIAVLSALNLAFELVSAPQGAVSSAPDGAAPPQVSDSALGHLIDRLDAALKDDGHLL